MTDREARSARDAGTMIALFCLIVGSALFIGFAAAVMPQLLGVFLVVGLFLGAVALHYVVWGWWLTAVLKTDESEARDAKSSDEEANRGSPAER